MTPERWRKVMEIFQAALARPVAHIVAPETALLAVGWQRTATVPIGNGAGFVKLL